MLFALPTGILYFTAAVTGIALAIGLTPILIGIPLALGLMLLAKGVLQLESRLAARLLNQPEPAFLEERLTPPNPGFWGTALYHMTDLRAYKGLLFMVLKLPLGIVSFTVTVTCISLSLGFIALPFVHYILINQLGVDILETNLLNLLLPLDLTYTQQSFVYIGVGLVFTWLTYHILSYMTSICAGFALFMAGE